MNTFDELHCGPDFDHGHSHDIHVADYAIIGSLSGLTVIVGAVALFKMVSSQLIADSDDRMRLLPFVTQIAFFSLCIACSCMRLPVLHSLCQAEGSVAHVHAMGLYVLYTSCYMLQWALFLAVRYTRLGCIFQGLQFSARKFIKVATTSVLVVSMTTWIANCIRLLTHTDALDHMNWWLGALSIGSLVVWANVLSWVIVRAVYSFHIQFNRANINFGTHLKELDQKIQLLQLATKLMILTLLSALSSVLMLVCVGIIGLLSHSMSGNLVFLLFIGHSIDVVGNCLAMYLAVRIGSAHYAKLCRPVQMGCHQLCKALVRRNERREFRKAERFIDVRPSTGTANSAAFAAALASSNHRLNRTISRNLRDLTAYLDLDSEERRSSPEKTQGTAQNPTGAATVLEAADGTLDVPAMLSNMMFPDPEIELELAVQPETAQAEAAQSTQVEATATVPNYFPFCSIPTAGTLTTPI